MEVMEGGGPDFTVAASSLRQRRQALSPAEARIQQSCEEGFCRKINFQLEGECFSPSLSSIVPKRELFQSQHDHLESNFYEEKASLEAEYRKPY
ncbi:hypothetical protein ACP70R_038179 [Stipagrostis hirtigluma subsp. patula]